VPCNLQGATSDKREPLSLSLAVCLLPDSSPGVARVWSKLMDVKNGYIAKVWKDLYDAEGVAVRIVPPLPTAAGSAAKGSAQYSWSEPRQIWVPDSKTHVAAEILRKI
jgi:hypothetical protein